jgi:hypothetical protein
MRSPHYRESRFAARLFSLSVGESKSYLMSAPLQLSTPSLTSSPMEPLTPSQVSRYMQYPTHPSFTRLTQEVPRSCEYPDLTPCSHFPCPHTFSTDADYLQDLQDLARDPVFHWKLWRAYRSLATRPVLKDFLPPDEWARYEPKFERCRRLELIRPEIEKRKLEICFASWRDPNNEKWLKTFPRKELPTWFQDFIDEESKRDPILAFAMEAYRKFHGINTTTPAS